MAKPSRPFLEGKKYRVVKKVILSSFDPEIYIKKVQESPLFDDEEKKDLLYLIQYRLDEIWFDNYESIQPPKGLSR